MIDLQSFINSYKNIDIDNIAYIKYEHKIADAFTKSKTKSIVMEKLSSSSLDYLVRQWIARRKARNNDNFRKVGL